MDEIERLQMLLDACHEVLGHIGERDDDIAQKIRETCEVVEQRVSELMPQAQSPA